MKEPPTSVPANCPACQCRTFAEMSGGGWRCINCKREYNVPPPSPDTDEVELVADALKDCDDDIEDNEFHERSAYQKRAQAALTAIAPRIEARIERARREAIPLFPADGFAERVKAFVFDQLTGLKAKDLAREMGVSEARLSQLGAPNGNPTVKTLERLLKAATAIRTLKEKENG